MNKVILIGNIGVDPEIKKVGNDQVCNFSLATSTSWNDKQTGEKKRKTTWHRCVAWGKTADIVAKYTKKGSKIAVEGSIDYKDWTSEKGEKHNTAEIAVAGITLLDKKDD